MFSHPAVQVGCASWKDNQGSFFSGLVKDVRLWDVAIEAPKLRSRMGVELTGLEPRLQVLLRCDEDFPTNIENRVASRAVDATGVAMAWTDLALDSSAFPYLLNQA